MSENNGRWWNRPVLSWLEFLIISVVVGFVQAIMSDIWELI